MDDWEQFFIEKSRRRADKTRDERRRVQRNRAITFGLILIVLIASVVALLWLRRSGLG